MRKRRKVRVSFQKNHEKTARAGDFTRQYQQDGPEAELAETVERVRAKGDASRRRTVILDEDDALALPDEACERGRVLMSLGLQCVVVTERGESRRCFIRRLLKSLESDERTVVAPGDWVWFRPAGDGEGLIVRVEPRARVLTRSYRNREHVIAANVDQVLIVGSLAQPELKPNLIDRYLVTASKCGIEPVICINKLDLADGASIQPLVGLYSQLGYHVVLTSVAAGLGIERLRHLLTGRETVIVGQSGVGKSSLLNALQPQFHLKVGDISEATQKGRHTTTTAQLLQLAPGGTVIDTPGVRQFELWAVSPRELSDHFVDLRPFALHCRFPGRTHALEDSCAVRAAVADGLIGWGRYESYLRLLQTNQRSLPA